MKKKYSLSSIIGAVLLTVTSCSNEMELNSGVQEGYGINFVASVRDNVNIQTRGIGAGEDSVEYALPYINNIFIRRVQASSPDGITASPYNVKTGNKGVLILGPGGSVLEWDKSNLKEPVDFFAWTTPSGVSIEEGGVDNAGTVNFVTGNTYNASADPKDQLNDKATTPLEVFISSKSLNNDYYKSPSVKLPFTHPVCKVSIWLRDWDNKEIKDGSKISMKFLFIPQVWNLEQAITGTDAEKIPFTVTTPVDPDGTLTLDFKNLRTTSDGHTYFTMYLPPLVGDYDFSKAGDFCITYKQGGGEPDIECYGSLGNLAGIKNLAAGQHMAIQLDLSKNYGVGIGVQIKKWDELEKTIYANPNRGIYSTEGLEVLADYLQSTVSGKKLPDSLYIPGSSDTIRLYNNLEVTDKLAAKLKNVSFSEFTFDGQGHTITLPAGNQGLFGSIKDSGISSGPDSSSRPEVCNLYLSCAGEITANGTLANIVTDATISNCHVIGGSIAPETGAAGGLIGTVSGTSTIKYCSSIASVTGNSSTGGLIGEAAGTNIAGTFNIDVIGCYAQCIVGGAGDCTGGLIGYLATHGTLKDSFFYSDGTKGWVSGGTYIGALAGKNEGKINSCFWMKSEGLGNVGTNTGTVGNSSSFEGNVLNVNDRVVIGGVLYTTFIEALRALVPLNSGINWVWVYGKDYPVIEIK